MRGQVFSVLPAIGHHCGEATVNRKLSTVSIFYLHATRHGLDLGELITSGTLQHAREGGNQSILDSYGHLRDRLLFALLHDAGIRIGEALGLRHEDIAVAEREITVRRRDSTNGARAKSPHSRTVPVSAELIRLYADYLHVEYGDLDSDYVFVNLFGRPHGQAMTYAAVYALVRRLQRQTGVGFEAHWFRHAYAGIPSFPRMSGMREPSVSTPAAKSRSTSRTSRGLG
jgi:integrase